MFSRLSMCCRLAPHLMYTCFQILYGAWKIARVGGPYVSIFGSARFSQDDVYARQAHKVARMLVNSGVSVLTGGGAGIMQAASCGAVDQKSKAKSIGIGVRDLDEGKNQCVQMYFELEYFFARKWLLTHYSTAFIVFPGGYGTLDELTEVLTLIQTKKLKRVPIILVGKEYWGLFMDWIVNEAVKHGALNECDLELFTVTDDLNEAFCLARNECSVQKNEKEN